MKGEIDMTKRRRILAVILAAVIVFTLAFSSFYIIGEYNHHCIGNDCPVCEQIRICEKTLGSSLYFGAVLLFTVFMLTRVVKVLIRYEKYIQTDSLVCLKQKLTN